MKDYEFVALRLHGFLLLVLMLRSPNLSSLDDRKVLILPIIFWEIDVDRVCCVCPIVSVEIIELLESKFWSVSHYILPDIQAVALFESVTKQLRNEGLESIVVHWLSAIVVLSHASECFLRALEFYFQGIDKLISLLGLPIIRAKQANEVILKQVAFLVLIQVRKDEFEDVIVCHESWKHVISFDPLLKCGE